MIPAEGRDQVAPNAEDRQNQPGKPERARSGSNHKTAAQIVQDPRVHGHLLSPNAAFQRRVQMECGPITFPALRRHCIASFGIHYRWARVVSHIAKRIVRTSSGVAEALAGAKDARVDVRPTCWDREFADSPLEGVGFELSI